MKKPERVVVDVTELPTVVFGSRGLLWWGTWSFAVVESMTLLLTIASYFYLRRNFESFPPAGYPLPDWVRPTIGVAIYVLTLVPAYFLAARRQSARQGAHQTLVDRAGVRRCRAVFRAVGRLHGASSVVDDERVWLGDLGVARLPRVVARHRSGGSDRCLRAVRIRPGAPAPFPGRVRRDELLVFSRRVVDSDLRDRVPVSVHSMSETHIRLSYRATI